MAMNTVEIDYSWIKNFDPEKSLIKGSSYLLVKRIFDFTVVLLTLPIWGLVICIVGILIFVTSPGAPVMFTRFRAGKGGKPFKIYKFRTMVPNAEALKATYAHLNELEWPDFKITNDPRVTTLGKILRKTSLDELPQLINILRGEMSLVGPRPTDWGPESYQLWQTQRLEFPPGLTGLWQIIARGSVNMDERTRMDIAYMKHACLWLDIYILFCTIGAVVKPRGTV